MVKFALVLLAAVLAAPLFAQDRIALVIGNSAYKDSPLSNPGNDAADMAKALGGMGFKVILRRNANTRAMRQAIREFGTELRGAQVGLFYYAGHGVQVRGANYLVPVGADIRGEADVEDQGIDANYVLRTMEEAQTKMNIVILDACRNNPYASGFRSATRGLAQMTAATGTLIAFSTAPGSVAQDGSGRNGLYTQHLLESLRQSDSDILKVFQRTRAGVVRDTGGKQTPWESTSLTGDFYFHGGGQVASAAPTAVAIPAPQADPAAIELTFWDSIKESTNAADFEEYLKQFPNGQFAGLARNRALQYQAKPVAPPQQSASVQVPANDGGRAKVYFMRPGSYGLMITITVTDRGRIIGDLPGGSYFLYDAPVGDLILSWEGHNGPAGVTRSLNVTAGKIYYLEASIGFWGGITVRTLDDAEGAERIKALAQARR